MKKTITIIIMAVIILGLGGYIAYDKLYTKELKPEETKEVEEKVDVVDGYIYEATIPFSDGGVHCEGETPTASRYNVVLPKIDSSKENAKALTEKIEKEFKPKTDTDNICRYDVSYEYLIKNDVIYININFDTVKRGSGGNSIKSYYYDIKNDKILTSEEAYKVAGFTIDDLTAIEVDPYANVKDFAACDEYETRCGCGIEIENNALKPYFNNYCL